MPGKREGLLSFFLQQAGKKADAHGTEGTVEGYYR
jgi:hypothetical protein